MKTKMFVNGEWTESESRKKRDIINPATSEVLTSVPESSAADAVRAIEAARRAFDQGPWRQATPQDRAKLLNGVASNIREKAEDLSALETRDCGKPLAESRYDIEDAASCFEYYAGMTRLIAGKTISVPANATSTIVREPVGVCGQIIPWNYPLLMAAWKLAPALAAGNTCVLKPSELTPLTALELAEIFQSLDLPPGVVNIITGPGAGAGEELSRNPMVDKIAFTGGTATGRKIMIAASESIKKISLELGGKNPNIVFEDADFEAAVDGALFGAFANQGEVCSAGSRLLVQRPIYKKMVDAMVAIIPRIKLGNGLDPAVKMGPLVSDIQRQRVEDYVQIGKSEGARLVVGGSRPRNPELQKGFFFEPTIFDQATPSMRISREEIFGPVLTVIPFDSEEEGIRIANDTPYGLAAAVWSKDISRAHRVIKQIRAGITWINTYHPTFSELPWGGYKQSGIGRELGLEGIDGYLETKQITINLDPQPIGWY